MASQDPNGSQQPSPAANLGGFQNLNPPAFQGAVPLVSTKKGVVTNNSGSMSNGKGLTQAGSLTKAPLAAQPKKAPRKNVGRQAVTRANKNGKNVVQKPLSEDDLKLARLSVLLTQFTEAANALHDEFDGTPDQIDLIADRSDMNRVQAIVKSDLNPASKPLKKIAVADASTGPKDGDAKYSAAQPSSLVAPAVTNAPPHYYVEDSKIQILPDTEAILPQQESITKIFKSLAQSPLGFSTVDGTGLAEEIFEANGKVTLSPKQWDVAKDCLSIVHFMNDYSILSNIQMFNEARGALIRQFGWAPGIGEMIKAKLRAQNFRVEQGKHITALGTKEWLVVRTKAYQDRGEGTVWKETVEKAACGHQQGPPKTKGPVWGSFSEIAKGGNNVDKEEGKAGRNDNPGHAVFNFSPSMAAHTISSLQKKKAEEAPSAFKAFVESKLRKSQVWNAALSQHTDDDTRKAKSMPPHRPTASKPGRLARVIDAMISEDTEDEIFLPAQQFSGPSKTSSEPPDFRKPFRATAANLLIPLRSSTAASNNDEGPKLRTTSAALISSIVPAKRSASPADLGKDGNGKEMKLADTQHYIAEGQQNKAKRIQQTQAIVDGRDAMDEGEIEMDFS